MSSSTIQTPDPAKLDAFLGQVVGDAGAAMSAALVVLGAALHARQRRAQAAVRPG